MTDPTIGTDQAIEWLRPTEQEIAAMNMRLAEINTEIDRALGEIAGAAMVALSRIGKAFADSFPTPQKPAEASDSEVSE